jgi:hypothetical protein
VSRGLGEGRAGYMNVRRHRKGKWAGRRRRFYCQECNTIYRSPPRAPTWHAKIYGHRVTIIPEELCGLT